MHIAEGRALPQLPEYQERSQHKREHEQPKSKILKIDLVLRLHVAAPADEIALVKVEEHALLTEREH